MKKNKKNFLYLIIFLFLPQIIGFLGAAFTIPAIKNWYQSLQKPFFSPPKFIFAPVWTLLYFFIGIASYLVFKEDKNRQEVRGLLEIYFIHLFLNLLWTILFFGFKSPLLAFLEIIILWVFVLFLTVNFYKINKASGILFSFYLAWISFVSVLNFAIFILN